MPNVPNIVRERLKAAASSVDRPDAAHPDANVLTAFAERSLPAPEREVLLEHVARCGECREVLILALPATEELQVVLKPSPAGSRWLTWPALRWGFVAAGIALIGSLGVVQYQRGHMPAPTASNLALHNNEVAANQPVPKVSVLPPAGTTQASAGRRDKAPSIPPPLAGLDSPRSTTGFASESKDESPREELTLEPKRVSPVHNPAIGGTLIGAFHGGPDVALNQQQAQSQIPAQAQISRPLPPSKQQDQLASAPAASAPATAETVEVQSESVQVSTEKPSDLPKQNGSADRASVNYSESGVGKAKLPVASPGSGSAAAGNTVNPLPLQTEPSLMRAFVAPLPRWRIGASSNLQRSYDGGNTWQSVDVNAAATSGAAVSYMADAKAEKDGAPNNLKRATAPVAPTIFRAVTASGADVWAGGSSGALYHSLDAGAHWSRISPSYSGAVLTGDIVTLQFSDTQHGTVTTSSYETWITADDGQTWQKQ